MDFKVNSNQSFDEAVVHTQDPGIYAVTIESAGYGEKFKGKGKDSEPCIDTQLRIEQVLQLHNEELDATSKLGKPVTDRINFGEVGDQEEFDLKMKRVMHLYTKAGVKPEDIGKIKLPAGEKVTMTEIVQALAAGLDKLLTDAVKEKAFCYKVIGSVIDNKMPYSGAPQLCFAAASLEEGMRFAPKEIQNNNAYYQKLKAQPSPESDAGGATGGAAPEGGDKPAKQQLF